MNSEHKNSPILLSIGLLAITFKFFNYNKLVYSGLMINFAAGK